MVRSTGSNRHGSSLGGLPLFGLLVLAAVAVTSVVRAGDHNDASHAGVDPNWSELNASMDKMHTAMGAIARSGNADVDFVRLMIPHHQGAIDMAKVQLIDGKDPQMRRLAQEIITDQQLEIELMQRWLKAHESQSKENDKSAAGAAKDK